MTLTDLIVKDDALVALTEARHNLLEWVSQALGFAEEFPLEKHSPENFLATYRQMWPEAHPDLAPDDVKRAFALYLLSTEESDALVIPDEWVLYDDVAFFMKELWY